MEGKKMHGLQYFVIICQQKKKDKFLKLLTAYDAHSVDTVYGKGSANCGALALALGLEIDCARAVISCLLPTPRAAERISVLLTEYGFSKPNTGIAFSVPVEGLAF